MTSTRQDFELYEGRGKTVEYAPTGVLDPADYDSFRWTLARRRGANPILQKTTTITLSGDSPPSILVPIEDGDVEKAGTYWAYLEGISGAMAEPLAEGVATVHPNSAATESNT